MVIAAYGAMAIWRRRLVLAWVAMLPDDAWRVSARVPEEVIHPARAQDRGALRRWHAELAMRRRIGGWRCATEVGG